MLPPLFPAISEALVCGAIGTDAAAVVIRCLTQAAQHHATPTELEHAEQQLALVAAREPADLVAVHARAWREALDPGAQNRETLNCGHAAHFASAANATT